MPYPNWHAARIVDPDSFIASSFRNKTIADGIELILGKKTEDGPMETQAVRFDKDKFTPEEARKWLKDNDYSPISFESAASVENLLSFDNLAEFTGQYDITLQTLETRHPHPAYPAGLEYSVENFSGTEPMWESRDLVVFVPPGKKVEHLDHAAFTNDPLSEVNRLGYRIAGRLNNTRIITDQGAPRVVTQVMLTDTEAKKYADKRQLGLSDAFDAMITPDGKLSGKVVPNHVLLFLKCAGKSDGFCGIPNDRGAQFNNLSEETMTDDDTKGILSKILDNVTPKENPLQKTVDNLTVELAAKDAKIDALTKENEALKAAKTSLDNLMAEQETKAKDAKWAQIKNLLKPGLYHKPEDEKALRAAFEADAGAFMIANIGNLQTVKPSPAKGAEAVGNLEDDDGKPFDTGAARGKLNPATGRFE